MIIGGWAGLWMTGAQGPGSWQNPGVRFSRVAPIALILAAAVACTSDGSSDPTQTPSTRAPSNSSVPVSTPPSTPTPTIATTGPNVRPGEKPPVLSELAKKNTPVGATLFAKFWFQALDWGYATTDSTLARGLFAGTCSECERFAAIFDKAKARQAHFKGGRIRPSRASVASDRTHVGSTAIDVQFSQERVQEVGEHSQVLKSAHAQRNLTYRVWAMWEQDAWTVIDLKQAVQR